MKNTIYFVTTSTEKFQEIKRWLTALDPSIHLEQSMLDVHEIQSADAQEIAITKAQDAFSRLGKPLIVDDAGAYLEKYPLFPGTLTKFIRPMIGIEGVLELAGENRNAWFSNCLVYIESVDRYCTFKGITKGKLIDPAEKDVTKKLHITDVMIPDGYTQTFAQLKNSEQFKYVHYRYLSLKSFVDWFKKNN